MVFFSPKKMCLDNVPSTSGFHNQFELSKSLAEVNHLHIIFDINGFLVAR
jgi:hypothetical protein